MKHFVILLTVLTLFVKSGAQPAEDSVKAVIDKMFLAMKNADAAMLKSTFADSMVLQTISTGKEGKIKVWNEAPEDFAAFLAREQPGNLDERITFDVVKTDGPLAIAWTPYRFYYKGKFSHCGVNSFQLVRQDGEWKIQYLIDTRRKSGCGE